MISADLVPNLPGAARAMLEKAGLGTAENWIFSDGFVERLRFEIDPAWQGEIPRTLLIARDGTVTTIEGSAEIPDLEKWLAQQKVAANEKRAVVRCCGDFGRFGVNMRRRLEVFIPIVLLSIMVQLLAPIGAFRAVAHAVSDPLYMATICSGMASVAGRLADDHRQAAARRQLLRVLQRQPRRRRCGRSASVDLCRPAAAIPAHRMAGSCGSDAAGARRLARAGARATRLFLTTSLTSHQDWCGPGRSS